jgi:DNA-binding response OmpR family regulator
MLEGVAVENLRILLVEDDQMVRLMAADFLREEGFDVTEVATGDDAAIQLADVDDFGLVFTDVQMPGGKDGIDVAVRARELYPQIAVIVASGYTPNLIERLDVLDPPAVFFRKPYRSKEVLDVIRQLVH